jgi:hypothetical protein
MSLQEAKENQKQIYGPNMDPDMYQGDLGNCMYFICIIGLSLIPLEIFLEDLVVNRIEDPIILAMQARSQNNTLTFEIANQIMNLSEVDVLRYTVYLLYLIGDAILATKTALVAFYGQFFLVFLKINYKEERPYWVNPSIKSYRCQGG